MVATPDSVSEKWEYKDDRKIASSRCRCLQEEFLYHICRGPHLHFSSTRTIKRRSHSVKHRDDSDDKKEPGQQNRNENYSSDYARQGVKKHAERVYRQVRIEYGPC